MEMKYGNEENIREKTSPLFSMTSTPNPQAEFLPHPWTIGCYAPGLRRNVLTSYPIFFGFHLDLNRDVNRTRKFFQFGIYYIYTPHTFVFLTLTIVVFLIFPSFLESRVVLVSVDELRKLESSF